MKKLFNGLIVFILIAVFSYALVGTVNNFVGQANPFNITFTGGDNHTYFLHVPRYAYVSSSNITIKNINFIESGLIHYWAMEEGNDTTIANYANSSYRLGININRSKVLGKNLYGVYMNQKKQDQGGKELQSIVPLDMTPFGNQWTIRCWVNVYDSNPHIPYSDFTTTDGWFTQSSGGYWRTRVQCPGQIATTNINGAYGRYYHVVTVSNGTGLALYINGTTKTNWIPTSGCDTNGQNFSIGETDNSIQSPFYGVIDECAIWNRQLSDSEILKDYNDFAGYFLLLSNISVYTGGNLQYNENSAFIEPSLINLNNTEINNILNDGCSCQNCSIDDSYCNIPVTFYSSTVRNLGVNLINFTYAYGVDNCSEFTIPAFNVSYFDILTNNPITARNDYSLNVISPFTQSLGGVYSAKHSHAFCSPVNYSKRSTEVEITGSINIKNNSYSTYISQYSADSPLILPTGNLIDIFMLNIGNTSQTTFTVKDLYTKSILPGVAGQMYKVSGGSSTLVGSKISDVTGRVIFDYETDIHYTFILSKFGYTDYTFDLNPITSASYDIFMTKTTVLNQTQPFDRVVLSWTPRIYYANQTNNFIFTITSPFDDLNSYSYTLTYPSSTKSNSGSNPSGEVLTSSFNITGATQFDRVKLDVTYDTETSGTKTFTYYYDIVVTPGNYTMLQLKDKTYGLGIFERLLISVIFVLLVVGLASLRGQVLPGMFLGMALYGYFVYIGFIPLWSILLPILISIIIISGRSE